MWVWKYWNTHLLVQMNFTVWVSLMAGSDKSYPSWHLYLVWSISSSHFLCWFNSFEGYCHSNFWKFLSKFAVTFCVEAMFTLMFYISPFLYRLKHSGTSLKSDSFSLMKVLFVTLRWQASEEWGKFCQLL